MKPLLQFNIDNGRVSVFNLGYLALDGGAMFGVVPRILWSRLSPPDDRNRIHLATNCLLIEIGDEKIMVDTGCGEKFNEKHRDMYGLQDAEDAASLNNMDNTPIERALASVGLKTGDITKIIFTHLHFDHAGGATRLLADGTVVPAFENAQYIVHEGEWNYGICPHERCKASYLKDNLAPLEASGRLTLLSGERNEIAPGLWQAVTGGHTPSHQLVYYECAGTTKTQAKDDEGACEGFVYWGDLIPTRHHLKIPYVMGYDEYPVETMAAKRLWLKRAHEQNWLSLFEHDPDMPACRLQASDKPNDYLPLPLEPQPV